MNSSRIHAGLIVVALLLATTARAQGPARLLLLAEFDNHPLDLQIGAGGPTMGEPVSLSAGLSAIVRAAPMPTPSLELSHAATGLSRYARFEFFDGEEIIHGDLVIRFRFINAQMDKFNIYVREPVMSTRSFLTMALHPSGDITVNDAAGAVGVIGAYTVNTNHLLVLRYRMDFGTYDIELDGTPLLTGRAHGITDRGIGALLIGTDSLTVPGSRLYVDRVTAFRGDAIFTSDFE